MAKQREIAVDIEDRYSEAVSDMLLEAGAEGSSIEDDETRALDKTPPTGRALVRAYFANAPGVEARVAAVLSELFSNFSPTPDAGITWRDIEDKDWNEEWKKRWQPNHVTARLVVVPTWLSYEAKPDELTLTMDPGMAFGTGTHVTTQLCAEAIEGLCGPQTTLLDVGCGSGILAMLGAKLGAASVLAVDNDADAVAIARQNAIDNGLGRTIRFAVSHNVGVAGQYDLAVANILMQPLLELAEPIANRVAAQGQLLLSGLLEEQLDKVSKAYGSRGLIEEERRKREGWGFLRLRSVRGPA